MDSKSANSRSSPIVQPPSRRRYAARWGLPLVAALMTFLAWPVPSRPAGGFFGAAAPPFTWDQVLPSSSLVYQECGNGFQCARLEVPMDYNRTDGRGRKFALAVVRLPAKVPVTDPRYGGAMLINPGGPGGSGAAQALLSGRNLQTIVDAERDPSASPQDSGDKYFDIVGFDPRGVGSTTPAVICFPDPVAQRNWEMQGEAEGMLGSSADSLRRNWQRTLALNQGCSAWELSGTEEGEALAAHVNTPLVARDMVTIIERHGEWREKEGQKAQQAHDQRHGVDEEQSIVRRTQWRRGEEPLLYWGRSYGTLLGTTFAALFPDRVSRAILDGVVDMDAYYRGTGPNVVVDADAIFERFGEYCYAVGPGRCPLYVEGGPDAIKDAYWALEARILNMSVPVMASTSRGPEVITWTDVKTILRGAVYQPLLVFPILAERISELAKGNAAAIADLKHLSHVGECAADECRLAGPWSPECARAQDNLLYASAAILCTDAEYLTQKSVDEFQTAWDSLRADSATLGDYWAQLELSCVGWKAKAKHPFTGPWGGTTSHPMLFVSNTLDPVTPLRGAQKMSRRFTGSAVLQQDSEGHTTLAAPSLCVAKAIRNYFQTGVLPELGTLCKADLKPLIGVPSQSATRNESLSPTDRELFKALMAEVKRAPWPKFPL